MRVAIDCRWIFPKISGIGKHTENLVRGLSKIDRKNTYLLLKEPLVNYGIFSLANQFRLPRLLRRLDVDVYHSTNFMIPLFMKKDIKVVVTIHDLIPWKFPKYTPRAKKTKFKRLFKWMMKRAVKRADKIIAVSENTAKDIRECLGVDSNKIKVVYNGISPEFFTGASVNRDGYILFVGRRDPYKNLSGLIKAYEILLEKYTIKNNLLVVGEKDSRYPEAYDLVKFNERITFYGYADTKDLVNLYRKASVLVMPSLYEGFGYPAIEAMACGVPVVVSNTPALAEVVKDNGIYIDPNDYEGMADGIYRALIDGTRTTGTRNKTAEYAKKFTIEKMAEETVKVYESCIGA